MIREFLPQISLLVLVAVIAVGFIKKINIGFFSIGAAFLLMLLAWRSIFRFLRAKRCVH